MPTLQLCHEGILDFGFWILDLSYWSLVIGHWSLVRFPVEIKCLGDARTTAFSLECKSRKPSSPSPFSLDAVGELFRNIVRMVEGPLNPPILILLANLTNRNMCLDMVIWGL